MATGSEVHPATLKFQLAVPNVVQTISPALAALHVTRFRLIHSPNARSHTFDTTHCTACGSLLTGGTGSVRVMRKHAPRKSGKPYLRVVRRSCEVCGEHQDVPVPIEGGGASGFAKVGKQRLQEAVRFAVNDRTSRTEPVAKVEPIAVSLKPSLSPVPPGNTPRPASSSARIPGAKDQEPKSGEGRSKPRAKKKSGLSDLLTRNKERQEKERSAQGSTGLAAFLQNL